MQKERILIVDDSEMNRSILTDMLSDEYETEEAENGVEAVSILEKQSSRFSLVLLDIVMPEMDGFDVLKAMNRMRLIEDIPVIMVSAETASSQIERAYELGATDFIIRPFDSSIVLRRVTNTILLYAKQKTLVGIVEEQIYEKEQNNSLMVDILSHIVEFRNGESGLHIQHVKTLTDFFLRMLIKKTSKYNITDADVSVIIMASALHDIGKIAIKEEILNKPGKLTPEEFEIMKTHSVIGADMLKGLPLYQTNPLVQRAYEICRWHHERYDGRGYPDGLKGDEIPISAQIVALADVYDALTSERVYKPPFPHDTAVKMILDGKCGAFNPLLLSCLAENENAIGKEVFKIAERRHLRISTYAEAVVHAKAGGASERTLSLLDYERMKNNFYAAMSEEVQFEYLQQTDMLKVSSWGANKLGVPENILSPRTNPTLQVLLGDGWWEKLSELFQKTSFEKPEISAEHQLMIRGELRWYNLIFRVIWSDSIPPQITGLIGKAVDIHDAHTKFIELKEKARRDPLTGLLNRAGAMEQIDRRLLNYPEHRYAVVCFDIDLFKNANDIYGHLFGDKVLLHIAGKMSHCIRASDISARIGGDEFLIFLEFDTDLEPIVARIFRSLCSNVEEFSVTVSMGVAEMEQSGETYEDIFRRADKALYCSKRSGRAQYHIYDDSMKDILPEHDEDFNKNDEKRR